jgi:hypothetical protein
MLNYRVRRRTVITLLLIALAFGAVGLSLGWFTMKNDAKDIQNRVDALGNKSGASMEK